MLLMPESMNEAPWCFCIYFISLFCQLYWCQSQLNLANWSL